MPCHGKWARRVCEAPHPRDFWVGVRKATRPQNCWKPPHLFQHDAPERGFLPSPPPHSPAAFSWLPPGTSPGSAAALQSRGRARGAGAVRDEAPFPPAPTFHLLHGSSEGEGDQGTG